MYIQNIKNSVFSFEWQYNQRHHKLSRQMLRFVFSIKLNIQNWRRPLQQNVPDDNAVCMVHGVSRCYITLMGRVHGSFSCWRIRISLKIVVLTVCGFISVCNNAILFLMFTLIFFIYFERAFVFVHTKKCDQVKCRRFVVQCHLKSVLLLQLAY